jgi:phage tail-like protein
MSADVSELRPYALLRTGDQWIRSSFEQTFLDLQSGIVELAWSTTTLHSNAPAPAVGAGLAFDNECRLYHSRPDDGVVERLLVSLQDPAAPVQDQPIPTRLIGGDDPEQLGDFSITHPGSSLVTPRGLAVDVNDRLFVADAGADRVLVYDLWSERLLRVLAMPGEDPTDLAVDGVTVHAVLSGSKRIVTFTARSQPIDLPLPTGFTVSNPSRIAVAPGGTIAILGDAGTLAAHIWVIESGRLIADLGNAPEWQYATDIEWESDTVLVVARQPGADFVRLQIANAGQDLTELPPLRARGYDGLGIVAIPPLLQPANERGSAPGSRRIGFWTDHGFRSAIPARLEYARTGRVTTFVLDSGAFQNAWGRLFLDACIPDGTDVCVDCVTLDEMDDTPTMVRLPPGNVQHVTIARPHLSPAMLPIDRIPDSVINPLHRRESGRELPWTQPVASDPFETYEAPIVAPPGRYLWITLELRGNTKRTPRIKCIRAEHPSHDYLRRLPRTFSRDPSAASFLLRYLAIFEGFLGEIEARGVDRDLLLDPRSTPDEALPWLASFLGLVLDELWAKAPAPGGRAVHDVRRTYIEEAAWLFRRRGTVGGLQRFIEIYTGVPVIMIENFRLRGIGGALLGDTGAAVSSSILGAGFRVGGALDPGITPISGTIEDAFMSHAHRFAVIIPAVLTPDQLGVVDHILKVHRPAHTMYQVCTVGAGMRVGRGLIVAMTSVIGPTGGFSPIQLGDAILGRDAIIGRPEPGAILGSARVGEYSAVG